MRVSGWMTAMIVSGVLGAPLGVAVAQVKVPRLPSLRTVQARPALPRLVAATAAPVTDPAAQVASIGTMRTTVEGALRSARNGSSKDSGLALCLSAQLNQLDAAKTAAEQNLSDYTAATTDSAKATAAGKIAAQYEAANAANSRASACNGGGGEIVSGSQVVTRTDPNLPNEDTTKVVDTSGITVVAPTVSAITGR